MTRMMRHARLLVAAGIAGTLLIGGQAAAAPGGNGWNSAGGDRQNTRYAASETKISPATVGGLTNKWELRDWSSALGFGPTVISTVLLREAGLRQDDASVVVLRA